jgi:hypothetical protein
MIFINLLNKLLFFISHLLRYPSKHYFSENIIYSIPSFIIFLIII